MLSLCTKCYALEASSDFSKLVISAQHLAKFNHIYWYFYKRTNYLGSRGSSSATGFAAGNRQSTQEEVTARPNYAYEFKVADDDEQTYITHNEARDGDDVTGTYSYVDPNGALITVNYQAGAMGYTQTLDKQEGAVSIRSKTGSSSSVGATSATSSAFGSTNRNSNANRQSAFTTSSQSSSAVNESDLIARIIAALGPQINSAVNTAVSSQRSNNVVSRTVTSNTGSTASVAGDRLT
ncbi:MAG: chitin-binding domain-containing protein, partial [Gammaproteobacteria bacterium]|nr:chitin-binding domain-containing protein [Gammaproteobacteria bacterium]